MFYKQGERNSQLVAMVTFLAHNVSKEIAKKLTDYFYLTNAEIFINSFERHQYEAQSHLDTVLEGWSLSLNEAENTILTGVKEPHLTAARICKTLAALEIKDFAPPLFYLSQKKLGDRLGVEPKVAGRILTAFVGQGLLKVITPGTQHSKAGPGKATVYRWNC